MLLVLMSLTAVAQEQSKGYYVLQYIYKKKGVG